jgi:hypothetical protein
MPKSQRSRVQSSRPAPSIPVAQDPTDDGPRGLLVIYSMTVFLSAFLLFQVQPLIGKYILPWFGGTPGVWTTCMLVFQVLLFGGYLYAHLTSRWLSGRMQAGLHVALLAGACLMLPIIPGKSLEPTGSQEPIIAIVLLLALTVGLPFFALSATGPLLQSWHSRTHPGRPPYRLYALSNVASLLALISFPAVFEWLFATSLLARIWSLCFGGFAVLCAICAWRMAGHRGPEPAELLPKAVKHDSSPPSAGTRMLWFALAMVPSTLLLATTNQVCMDIASVPFLWVLPLTLYLLSFILCFESERWYSRRYLMPATAVALGCIYPVLSWGNTLPLWVQVLAFFSALFLSAMVCHGELYARRPHPQHLTAYYLLIAAGGAAGGIFVGVVAPLVFGGYYELHLGLFACSILMLVVLYTDPKGRFGRGRSSWAWVCFVGGAGALGALLLDNAQDTGGYQIASEGASNAGAKNYVLTRERTFYGILRVASSETTYKDQIQPIDLLINGRTTHGFEYTDPALSSIPTAYYDHLSGIGKLLSQGDGDKPRRVGIVGLGIGTLAAYARPGDMYRFYEINEHVEPIARRYFHFLEQCRGKVEVIPGDGRLSLERESPQNFDLLILDAFSSDAVPIHLLTREAFAVYLRHLAPNGVLAFHVSNWHFDLRSVVEGAAEAHHLTGVTIRSGVTNYGSTGSEWELLARSAEPLAAPPIQQAATPPSGRRVLWTDDHASLFRVWLDR